MKLACSSTSFLNRFDGRSLDLLALADLAADLGLDGIDASSGAFPSISKKFQREFRERLDRRFVALSSIALASDFAAPDEADRARQVDDLVAWCSMARDLGAGVIRVLTGTPPADTAVDAARGRVLECLARALPAAERADVTLAVEDAGIANPLFGPDGLAALVMGFGSAHLQLCLTPFALDHRLAARHAACVRLPFDDAGADAKTVLGLCDKACFNGWLLLDYAGSGDAESDARALVSRLKALIAR